MPRKPFTKENAKEFAKRGGEATRRRLETDPDYYSNIGQKGAKTKKRNARLKKKFNRLQAFGDIFSNDNADN